MAEVQGMPDNHGGAGTFGEPSQPLLQHQKEHDGDDPNDGLLLDRYHNRRKLYLSWDAASWHISKRLSERIEENNKAATESGGPIVDTAPLPARAQFLTLLSRSLVGWHARSSTIVTTRASPKQRPQSIATLMNAIAISANTRAALATRSGARSGYHLSSPRGTIAKTRDTSEHLRLKCMLI